KQSFAVLIISDGVVRNKSRENKTAMGRKGFGVADEAARDHPRIRRTGERLQHWIDNVVGRVSNLRAWPYNLTALVTINSCSKERLHARRSQLFHRQARSRKQAGRAIKSGCSLSQHPASSRFDGSHRRFQPRRSGI